MPIRQTKNKHQQWFCGYCGQVQLIPLSTYQGQPQGECAGCHQRQWTLAIVDQEALINSITKFEQRSWSMRGLSYGD